MEGLYVAATPKPVRNADFMRELRRVMHRPWSHRVPAWMVRIGCFILRTEPVLALTGRRVRARRLEEIGFQFRYPELRGALESLVPRELRSPSRGTLSERGCN